jgi:hypothetical protein
LLVAPSLKEKEEKVMRGGGTVKLTEFCNNWLAQSETDQC